MSRTNYKTTLIASGVLAALASVQACAGEFQFGFRLGQNWLDVDGDRLSSGNSINDNLLNLGIAASYRWPKGGFIEAGLGGSGTIDIFGLESVSHRWIGGGWQYDLSEKWKLTPKAGLAYSRLTSSEEDFFDSEPVDKFSDIVPYVELTIERRLLTHLGLGAYFRHTFEEWGSTRDFGLAITWTFQ